jgi:hypothetical protein
MATIRDIFLSKDNVDALIRSLHSVVKARIGAAAPDPRHMYPDFDDDVANLFDEFQLRFGHFGANPDFLRAVNRQFVEHAASAVVTHTLKLQERERHAHDGPLLGIRPFPIDHEDDERALRREMRRTGYQDAKDRSLPEWGRTTEEYYATARRVYEASMTD